MALTFNGSSQYLSVANAAVTAYPFTMSCWFYITAAPGGTQVLMSVDSNESASHDGWKIDITTDRLLRAGMFYAGSAVSITTTTAAATNTWHHALYIGTSATSRTIYLNNGGNQTSTTNATPTGLAATYLAAQGYSGVMRYFGGTLAECAIWNISVDASERAALSKGICPLEIRPAALQGYWPLGGHSPASGLDRWRNNYSMTATGSPTKADHCRVIYPVSPVSISKGAAAPPSTKYWLFGGKSARLIGGGLGG